MNKQQRDARKVAKRNKKRLVIKKLVRQKSVGISRIKSSMRAQYRFEHHEQAEINTKREQERMKLKSENWREIQPYSFIRVLSDKTVEHKQI